MKYLLNDRNTVEILGKDTEERRLVDFNTDRT